MLAILEFGYFPKADFGRFWILTSIHVDQPKSTEELNKAILLNLGLLDKFDKIIDAVDDKSLQCFFIRYQFTEINVNS